MFCIYKGFAVVKLGELKLHKKKLCYSSVTYGNKGCYEVDKMVPLNQVMRGLER